MRIILLLSLVLFLNACFEADKTEKNNIKFGKITFDKNCVTCHGKDAQGVVKDWKKRQADGRFPAPPLNGTAHTWHHSPKVLLSIIDNGGVRFGGSMPGFKNKLNAAEKQALLDYIYSLWPKEIQQKYDAKFKQFGRGK